VTLHTATYDIEEGEWILEDATGREIERGTDLVAAAARSARDGAGFGYLEGAPSA
jgi:hypothetical protein